MLDYLSYIGTNYRERRLNLLQTLTVNAFEI